MSHLVLLGDSIFDNGAYVAGAPAVIDQVRRLLPNGWRTTLLAVDGSIAADVREQASRIPADTTHLVMSVGGNDALGTLTQLHSPTPLPMMQALRALADIQVKFAKDYVNTLRVVCASGTPVRSISSGVSFSMQPSMKSHMSSVSTTKVTSACRSVCL